LICPQQIEILRFAQNDKNIFSSAWNVLLRS
jgi:hypothetical protein